MKHHFFPILLYFSDDCKAIRDHMICLFFLFNWTLIYYFSALGGNIFCIYSKRLHLFSYW